jgi:hypothetical protein
MKRQATWLYLCALAFGILAAYFCVLEPAYGRASRLSPANVWNSTEVTEITTNNEYITTHITNNYYLDSNDTNDVIVEPPGNRNGNSGRVKNRGDIVIVNSGDYLGLDDSKGRIVFTDAATDSLVVSDGVVGIQTDSTPNGELQIGGTTPQLFMGDAGEEDSIIIWDGAEQDYHIGIDDTDNELKIGVGQTPGTTTAINITSGADVEIADDLILLGTARWGTDPNLGDVGATETLNFNENNNYVVLLDQNCVISVTDPSAYIQKGTVIFYQTGAGSYTVTWPSNFDWNSDTAPTLSTTSGDCDVLSYVYWSTEDAYFCTMSTGHSPE